MIKTMSFVSNSNNVPAKLCNATTRSSVVLKEPSSYTDDNKGSSLRFCEVANLICEQCIAERRGLVSTICHTTFKMFAGVRLVRSLPRAVRGFNNSVI